MKVNLYKNEASRIAIAVVLASNLAGGGESRAQDTGAAVIPEIVVTAQKRAQNLQDVPIAISAFSGDTLDRSQIDDIEDLQLYVPNLNIGSNLGTARISLRGVGLENLAAGGEGSIAFHVDGVYISRPAVPMGTMFDMERIEVLRGPQGTLYGRNATGGSINLISKKPTEELDGFARLTLGNYNAVNIEGAVGGSIIEGKLTGRIAIKTVDRDGYGVNLTSGNDIDNAQTRSARLQLQFTPSDKLDFLLYADYHRENDNAYGYHFFGSAGDSDNDGIIEQIPTAVLLGGRAAADPRDIRSDFDPKNDREFWSVFNTATLDLEAVTLKSITGYQSSYYRTLSDLDGTDFPLVVPLQQIEDSWQFTQELQASYQTDKLDLLVGAYYFHEEIDGSIDLPVHDIVGWLISGGALPTNGLMTEGFFAGGSIEKDAYAIFAQSTYRITDKLSATLGIRYSKEEKSSVDQHRFDLITLEAPNGALTDGLPGDGGGASDGGFIEGAGFPSPFGTLFQEADFEAVTPRFGLEYKPNEDWMVYASVARGFKAGGFNLGSAHIQDPFDPEFVWSYEIGAKADILGGRGRISLTGFYYDYSDLQVGKIRDVPIILENAASSTIKGLEFEGTFNVTNTIQADLMVSYLDAEFDEFTSGDPSRGSVETFPGSTVFIAREFDLSGNSLSQAPKFAVNFGLQKTWHAGIGDVTLRGEVYWVDDIFFTPFNRETNFQKAHSKQNLYLTWRKPDQNWTVRLFVRNLDGDDDTGQSFVTSPLLNFGVNGQLEAPRTFGAQIGYDW